LSRQSKKAGRHKGKGKVSSTQHLQEALNQAKKQPGRQAGRQAQRALHIESFNAQLAGERFALCLSEFWYRGVLRTSWALMCCATTSRSVLFVLFPFFRKKLVCRIV
jgi:hypothetical protein